MTDSTYSQLPCFLRFKREMAFVFILLGGLNLCLGAWLLRLGQFNITLILAIPFTLMGIRFFTQTCRLYSSRSGHSLQPIGK